MAYYDREDVEDVGEDIGEAVWRRPSYQYGRQSYIQPRPRPGGASNQQVTTAFEKVGGDVKTLAAQVKEIEQRVDTGQSRTGKALTAIRADLNQTKMISALLPLLSRPAATAQATSDGAVDGTGITLSKGDRLLKGSDDTMTMLLPLLLLTGTGFGGDSSQTQGGMDSSMMMILVLALAMRKNN